MDHIDTLNGRIEIGMQVRVLDTPSVRENEGFRPWIGRTAVVEHFGQRGTALAGLVFVRFADRESLMGLRGVEVEPVEPVKPEAELVEELLDAILTEWRKSTRTSASAVERKAIEIVNLRAVRSDGDHAHGTRLDLHPNCPLCAEISAARS